jgi:hypothetical protein
LGDGIRDGLRKLFGTSAETNDSLDTLLRLLKAAWLDRDDRRPPRTRFRPGAVHELHRRQRVSYWVGAKRLDCGDDAGALTKLLELGDYDGQRAARDRSRADGRLVGVGLSFELCPEGGDFPGSLLRGYDTSTVRVDPMGAVTVLTGVTSAGTGNETGIAQVVAGELGISVDEVSVLSGDTDVSPYGFGNFSSRGMNVGGGSALLAAREIRERLAGAAGVLLQTDPQALERLRNAGNQPLTLDLLRAGGIDFPAVVIGELELNGYVIERVYEHSRQIGVRLQETEAPDPPASRRRHRSRRVLATDAAKRVLRSAHLDSQALKRYRRISIITAR